MANTEKTVAKKTETKELSLEQQLVAKRAELLEAQKNLGTTLQNPHAIKNIKKEIARILTKINATKGKE